MNATETITVTIHQSQSGLLAEVEGLPVQSGPDYIAKARQREAAEEALRTEYPQLIVREAWSSGSTGYVFRVESV